MLYTKFEMEVDSLSSGPFCNKLQVEMCIISIDGEDYDFIIESITNMDTGDILELESLTKSEQDRLLDKADMVAYDKAYDSMMEAQIMKADSMLDSWKDGD